MSDFVTLFNQYKNQAGITDDRGACALLSRVLEQYKPEQQLTLLKNAIDNNLGINEFTLRLGVRADVKDLKKYLEEKANASVPAEVPAEKIEEQTPAEKSGPMAKLPRKEQPVVAPSADDQKEDEKPVEQKPSARPEQGAPLVPPSASKILVPGVPASNTVPGPRSIPQPSVDKEESKEEGADEDGGDSKVSVPNPVASNTPRRPYAPQQIEEPTGIKGWFKGRVDAFNEWREGLGPNKGKTRSASEKGEPKSGNASKWAFVSLAVLILLISTGVLWRLGNENGEYNSSNNSSATSLGVSACVTTDGLPGVTRYNITPNPDIFGLSGYIDPQRIQPYQNPALVFEQGKSYQAILVGENYRVGLSPDVSVYAPVFSFTQTGSECVQEVAVQVLTSGIENQQKASVQLAYKIDFSHWSGWLVALSLLSIFGFTGISLFMSGGKLKDFLSMIFIVAGTAYLTSQADFKPSTFFFFYVFVFFATVKFGSKSELQEQRDSFEAGNQLKLPQSMETLFKSLSRGWGLVGGYDWSESAVFGSLMMFVGAVYPSASPLVRAFDSQMIAIGVGALFVVFSFAMEAWRRGLLGDWVAFGLGFLGLLDFGIYYSAFGSNPPSFLDFTPTAFAGLGWTVTFIVAVLANFGAQAISERTELQRDRMADGMLFYSAMKLVAVLAYVFLFLM